MNQRLEQLFKFYQEDPSDPFTIYALALEYTAIDKEKAKSFFDELLTSHEDYVGTYYHAAQLYIDLEMNERAEEIFKKGLLICEKMNDKHALRELATAYQNFLYE